MDVLSDIITYVRRLIKSPSNDDITDTLIIDYINRFWINDVDARIQLFDLKTKYQFQTTPGQDQYNMPLYSIQNYPTGETQQFSSYYPVYQGFIQPCYINGVEAPLQTQKNSFFSIFPNIVQNFPAVAGGDGSNSNYTIQLPILPNQAAQNPPFQGILRGHIDISGVIAWNQEFGNNAIQDPPLVTDSMILANDLFIQSVPTTSAIASVFFIAQDSTNNTMVISDSGQFLADNQYYGLLMQPGQAPLGNLPLGTSTPGNPNYTTTLNTINYQTGFANVTFPSVVPAGNNINAQVFFYQSGLPRSILFYNNIITLRTVPDEFYLIELDAFLSPAAFFSTSQAVQFGYMSEYIARGAARKILSDIGDWEQYNAYEPMFLEQESLVWKRSQRQWTASRTETIYSKGFSQGQISGNSFGGGAN